MRFGIDPDPEDKLIWRWLREAREERLREFNLAP